MRVRPSVCLSVYAFRVVVFVTKRAPDEGAPLSGHLLRNLISCGTTFNVTSGVCRRESRNRVEVGCKMVEMGRRRLRELLGFGCF